MKVYLAHPISTKGEFNDSIRVAEAIETLGYEVYAPARNKEINDKDNNPTPEMIYKQDVERLLNCDVVVVNYTGGDADGTLLEIGILAGMAEVTTSMPKVLVYTSNVRALKPQLHNGIASGKLNHMVLGAIDKHFKWCSSESGVIGELDKIREELVL